MASLLSLGREQGMGIALIKRRDKEDKNMGGKVKRVHVSGWMQSAIEIAVRRLQYYFERLLLCGMHAAGTVMREASYF